MIAYIAELKRLEVEARRVAAANAEGDVETRNIRDLLTPLEDRLSRLLATIPVEIQNQGLSLASLQAGLRGRQRGHCHPGELGVALRRIGWRRRRQWDTGAGFRALWFPLQVDPG